ncbi:hypothetical protein EMIT0158MI4_130233 [Burkholderia ambifaria]
MDEEIALQIGRRTTTFGNAAYFDVFETALASCCKLCCAPITGKKKRHGDRGAKKVLAIPRAVLEPERLRETPLPVKLLKRCFENVRHSFRFRPTSQAVFAPAPALSGNGHLRTFLINQG